MTHRLVAGVLVLAAIGSTVVLRGQDTPPPRSVREGVYSMTQVRLGSLQGGRCRQCHGEDLDGETGPPLKGAVFVKKWNGRTLDELFDIINKDMPNDEPGTLSRRQSGDFLALILFNNDLPAGEKDLPIDLESLKRIRFEAPKP